MVGNYECDMCGNKFDRYQKQRYFPYCSSRCEERADEQDRRETPQFKFNPVRKILGK